MSIINLVYLSSVKPLENGKENMIEIFNEICILISSYLFSIFLRGDGDTKFLGLIGWVFIGVSVSNIGGNVFVMVGDLMIELVVYARQKMADRRVSKIVSKRRKGRELIKERIPGVFKQMELELKAQDAIKYCKLWIEHRKWLKSNNVVFDQFKEELEF